MKLGGGVRGQKWGAMKLGGGKGAEMGGHETVGMGSEMGGAHETGGGAVGLLVEWW